jgi:hypothetical protein
MKNEMSNAVLKLLHARMLLVASGGFLTGYDDKTLNALVAMAIKYDVKLFLCEPNYCGAMFTRLLIPAVQQYPYECGVEDAKFRSRDRKHPCEPALEAGPRSKSRQTRSPHSLFYQIARMVRAKGALAQDERLDALAGAVSFSVERIARDGHVAALDNHAPEFGEGLDKFFKHAVATRERYLGGTLRP